MTHALRISLFAATLIGTGADLVEAQVRLRSLREAVAAIEALGGRVHRTSTGNVDIIDLKGPRVSDDHLALLQSFPSVRNLQLDGSRVTDRGIEQLMDLPNLEEVSLRGTTVSEAAAASLKDRHPRIYYVQVDPAGFRWERLAIVAIALPLGAWGSVLVLLARLRRSSLPPHLYARGIVWGVLLMTACCVFLIVGLMQFLGVDFHLADLFG